MPDSVATGLRLAPEELTHPFAPGQFAFDTTDDLGSFRGVLDRERTVEALQFSVAMPCPGYNVFIMGEPRTGRFSLVKRYLQAEDKRVATPSNQAYLNNFDEPREPRVIGLSPGSAIEFSADIDHLIDNLVSTFPAVFRHPAYQQKKNAVDRAFNQRYDHTLDSVERRALEKDVTLYHDSASVAFTPMKGGKTLDEAEFTQLPEAERERFHKDIAALKEYLNKELASLPRWKRESSNQLRELSEEAITLALQSLLAPLVKKYSNNPGVYAYLQTVQLNLLRTVVDQLADGSRTNAQCKRGSIKQYAPNQAIVHHTTSGAPVMFESYPACDNLFGRVECSSNQGALCTSYRRLHPGALHRADGGFLILEAEKMLDGPFVWDALKRALQPHQSRMKSPLAEFGRLAAVSLTPQVIPLQLKMTVVDSRQIYYTLQDLDPNFQEVFRILVNFDEGIPLGKDGLEQFAQLLKTRTSEEGMVPLSGAAVVWLATYSARLAEYQGRLSAWVGDLSQLVSEAGFIRQLANEEAIQLGHIERALKAKWTRTGQVSARVLDDMLTGIILIDTAGAAVGKCNGLTVLKVGDSVFGVPARISATIYPDSSGIIDIERKASLSQPTHSKGVMILTGYLDSRYVQKFPLKISTSIAPEQSYGHVGGDGAPLGEVYTLASTLLRTLLKQCFAITDPINQFGEVQAIGGVDGKIEGFFRLCEARGLAGEQGMIIPRANVTTLMLGERVLQAVHVGQFHVYTVHEVNETLALLVGKPVGAQDEKGRFPKGSVNDLVVVRSQEISEPGMEENDKEKDKPVERETVTAKDKAAAKKD